MGTGHEKTGNFYDGYLLSVVPAEGLCCYLQKEQQRRGILSNLRGTKQAVSLNIKSIFSLFT